MSRYIDANELKQHYAWWNNEDKETFDEIVDAQPTADVRENVRGEWINKGFMVAECSNCQEQFHELEIGNFCPNCGADMRGGDAE